jgi:hypothetical protein
MPHSRRPIERALAVAVVLLLGAAGARGQAAPPPPAARGSASDDDHRAVIEIGAAGERGVSGSSASGGGTLAVEFTPIENWLEMETGLTGLRSSGRNEFAADLLFKKPWRLSATSEFMAGVGPELSHRFGAGASTSLATEIVADWMFWPSKNIGWYLEPSYSVTAWSGGERSVGIAAGLLIGLP